MAIMGNIGRPRAVLVALLAATALSTVCADLARTSPASVLDWETDSQVQLSMTSENSPVPVSYAVIPLADDLGLNANRGKIDIAGTLALADASTYASISGSDVIPYLSCDEIVNSYITTNEILNQLMSHDPQPQAILLYSRQAQGCGLTGQNLNFQRIFTMSNLNAAAELGTLTANAVTARATISGNATGADQDRDGQQTGNNSAVAMSILYSITGLITLLFLVIIAAGAVRAHRYPERYGPRSGFGGRSRQSRAKGLARAVLETLPIVKFGDEQPAKPDPNLELESVPRDVHNDFERHLSTIPESPINPRHNVEAVGAPRSSGDTSAPSSGEGTSATNNANAGTGNDEALGCSICTEDFTVGEDVRVLPCNHKFHPPCVDPWLVNVSGTCPLCRLDLRPENQDAGAAGEEGQEPLSLGAEANEAGDSSSSSRRRSRFYHLSRLRHASVEERLEALRRIRSEQGPGGPPDDENRSQSRAKLSERLRERFQIRTRAAQRPSEQTQTGASSSSRIDSSQSHTS